MIGEWRVVAFRGDEMLLAKPFKTEKPARACFAEQKAERVGCVVELHHKTRPGIFDIVESCFAPPSRQ